MKRTFTSETESYQSKGKLSVKGKLPVQRKVTSKPESYQSEVPLPAKRTVTRETASHHSNGQSEKKVTSRKKKLPVKRDITRQTENCRSNVFFLQILDTFLKGYHRLRIMTSNKCTSVCLLYIYKHSYMFRPVWAIFRELYTVEYDLVVKQYAVNIKQYVVRVVS